MPFASPCERSQQIAPHARERDRAFGHDARGWHRAREPPLAETVRERVDERGEIRAAACQARETFALPCALVLDQRRDERHRLDPEDRLDVLDLRRAQFREMYEIRRASCREGVCQFV